MGKRCKVYFPQLQCLCRKNRNKLREESKIQDRRGKTTRKNNHYLQKTTLTFLTIPFMSSQLPNVFLNFIFLFYNYSARETHLAPVAVLPSAQLDQNFSQKSPIVLLLKDDFFLGEDQREISHMLALNCAPESRKILYSQNIGLHLLSGGKLIHITSPFEAKNPKRNLYIVYGCYVCLLTSSLLEVCSYQFQS